MSDHLTASPAALQKYAALQSETTTRLAAHTASTDVSVLTPTFGIIGAEFLAALGQALAARRRRLETLTRQHATLSAGTTNAAASYATTDADAARRLGVRV